MNDVASLVDGLTRFDMSFQEFITRPESVWNKTARGMGVKVNFIQHNLSSVSDKNPVEAHISHGRLLADCPNCGGAEYVWRNGPHLIICANCGNADLGGKPRKVVIPENIDDIVVALFERPVPANRNWFPPETLEQLLKENVSMIYLPELQRRAREQAAQDGTEQ